MADEDLPKTVLITPFGIFEFTVICFELHNAAQTFQSLINSILVLPFIFVYLDVILASTSEGYRWTQLEDVSRRLDQYGLTINPLSRFCKPKI